MAHKAVKHLRQQWIGALALLLVLTGGSAYALGGHNTVFSDDIVNGEVKAHDVGAGQVGGGQVADDSTARALTGQNIAADSLNDSDIAESTVEPDAFGRFHDAAVNVPFGSGIGGNPRAGDEDILALNLPAGNYFIVAKGNLIRGGSAVVTCILYADGDSDKLTPPASSGPFTMSVLGGATTAFTVHLACNDTQPNPQCATCTQFTHLKINAVEVRTINNTAG